MGFEKFHATQGVGLQKPTKILYEYIYKSVAFGDPLLKMSTVMYTLLALYKVHSAIYNT